MKTLFWFVFSLLLLSMVKNPLFAPLIIALVVLFAYCARHLKASQKKPSPWSLITKSQGDLDKAYQRLDKGITHLKSAFDSAAIQPAEETAQFEEEEDPCWGFY